MTRTRPDHQGWMTAPHWAIRGMFGLRRNTRAARQRFTYARVGSESAGQPRSGRENPSG
ncbi:hypothetical protein GCM10022223_07650 [Kineosporia mesophila]|uniref:Uncharacterized protein n=1 Tax=Kineosporia mesophila TaxID=566012 RepID=A0ABP6Z1E4_9ACTN